MKLKSLLFAICFGLFGHAVAANQHMHPKANEVDNNKNSVSRPSMLPGYCQIEVINRSYDDVYVYGIFDDGIGLPAFMVPSFDSPHYIDLFYYGYCHSGMRVTIESIRFPYNVVIYDQFTTVNSTVRIVPYLANGLNKSENDKNVKVEVTAK
ncbi:hypothetical protein Lsan_2045 [Legionella santicrucis]|uniref:Secreted protein n=1 Tax=Legionella santicrucis TaxID=45074 RepID=A0A0W0YTN8_9GAMM|nr:hypothetical protein [Legionella santicrucis]KTD60267.1 hypothetical protein Lsan_2045 [Legionella santicrucis]